MLSSRSGAFTISLPLETDYLIFDTEELTRSPRTPTYLPESPSLSALPPFDHARALGGMTAARSDLHLSLPPAPDAALAWIWICHLCHSRYPLGVTRRCLIDGHYYCSGDANQPNLRRKKKRQSCSSEFDFAAWREWGDWRKKVYKLLQKPRVPRGCEDCVFPSQCHYPTQTKEPIVQPQKTRSPRKDSQTEISKDSGGLDDQSVVKDRSSSISNENVSFDQILENMIADQETTNTEQNDESLKWQGHRKGKSSQKSSSPFVEEEMVREAERVKQLVGVDLWNNLEDIDLEITRIE